MLLKLVSENQVCQPSWQPMTLGKCCVATPIWPVKRRVGTAGYRDILRKRYSAQQNHMQGILFPFEMSSHAKVTSVCVSKRKTRNLCTAKGSYLYISQHYTCCWPGGTGKQVDEQQIDSSSSMTACQTMLAAAVAVPTIFKYLKPSNRL